MSKRQNILLPAVHLPLMAAIKAMAQESFDNEGEGQEDVDLLEFYGETYMENLSIAGYSETRPNDRLSIRAFAHLIRANADDLTTLKNTLGYERTEYRDFALSDNLLSVLSRSDEAGPALHLLAPAEGGKSTGPFYPTRSTFDVAAALKARAEYIGEVKKIVGKDGIVDAAAVYLAGVFKLTGVDKVARQLRSVGVTGEAAVAHAVLIALRNDARLTAGLRCAQKA